MGKRFILLLSLLVLLPLQVFSSQDNYSPENIKSIAKKPSFKTINRKKVTYKNGDIWLGKLKNDLRSGKGKMTYTNGDRFEGEYKDGKRNGHGVYIGSDGDRYEGEWKDGKMFNGYKVEYNSRNNNNIKLIKYEEGESTESSYTLEQLMEDANQFQMKKKYDEAYTLLKFIPRNSQYWRKAQNDMMSIRLQQAQDEEDDDIISKYRNEALKIAIKLDNVDMIVRLHNLLTGGMGFPDANSEIMELPYDFYEQNSFGDIEFNLKNFKYLQKLVLSYQKIMKKIREEGLNKK